MDSFIPENTAIYFSPSVVFIVILLPISFLLSENARALATHKIQQSKLNIAAIVILVLLEAMIAALELLNAGYSQELYIIMVSAPTAGAVTQAIDAFKGRNPTRVVEAFMNLVLVADLARSLAYWITEKDNHVALTSAIAFAIQASRLLWVYNDGFSDHIKQIFSCIRNAGSYYSALKDGLWTTMTFGFRDIRQPADLTQLHTTSMSQDLSARFDAIWAKTDKKADDALLRATAKTLRRPLLAIIPARAGLLACQLYLILLMREIVLCVSQDHESTCSIESKPEIFMKAVCGLTVYLIVGVWREHTMAKFDILLRALLTSISVGKSFKLYSEDLQDRQANKIIHTEVELITSHMWTFHVFWMAPFEIAFGLYFFHSFEGTICYFMFPPLIVAAAIGYLINKGVLRAMAALEDKSATRIQKTYAFVSEFKGINMLGLQDTILRFLQGSQHEEVAATRKVRQYGLFKWVSFVWVTDFPPLAVIAGGIFVTKTIHQMSEATIFNVLAFISIITEPSIFLMNIGSKIRVLMSAFKRVQDFLLSSQLHDPREIVDSLPSDIPRGKAAMHREAYTSDLESGLPRTAVSVNERQTVMNPYTIELSNASIAPGRMTEPLIHSINWAIRRGQTIMVYGPSGAGKSTVLRAIGGEATLLDGSIFLRKGAASIGYCTQSPWLPNGTVRQTIIGNEEFDREWYNCVVQACQLFEELNRLPGRDKFTIGIGGCNLSGGQRQRVAIARAIYSHPSTVIFDDIFSSLDNDTAVDVFDSLIGDEGFLNELDTTVIMSTYDLSQLARATQVMFLESDHSFRIKNGDIAIGEVIINGIANGTFVPPSTSAPAGSTNSTSPEKETINSTEHEIQNGWLADDPGTVDTPLYFYLVKSISLFSLLKWFVMITLHGIVQRTSAIFLRVWAETAHQNLSVFWLYAMAAVTRAVVIGFESWLYHCNLVPQSSMELHTELLTAIFATRMPVLAAMDKRHALLNLIKDVSTVNQEWPMMLKTLIYGFSFIGTDFCLIIHGIPAIVFFFPFLLAALYLIKAYYFNVSRKLNKLQENSDSAITAHITATSLGLDQIRMNGYAESHLLRSYELLDDSHQISQAILRLRCWLVFCLYVITNSLMAMIVLICLYFHHSLSPAGIGLAILSSQTACFELQNFFHFFGRLDNVALAVARLRAFVNNHHPEKNGLVSPAVHWPETGAINLHAVSSHYDVGNTSYRVLRDVSMSIRSGQKVAIVGRSGSGKSSLIATMLNLVRFNGLIRFDGADISQLSPEYLHRRVTTISQNKVRFPGTLRDNIFPWDMGITSPDERTVSYKDITDVLAQLGLATYVEFHGGLDVNIDKMMFSHSQHQLVDIGRAILHHRVYGTKLVLIDEATNHMEPDMEDAVFDLMLQEFSSCTMFVVAHRGKILKSVDATATVSNGTVVVKNRRR